MDTLNAASGGPYPGHRAVHAKGTVCRGTFTPTPEASKLSRAAHLQGDPVEVTVRFSNASGNPNTSDAHAIAGRGMAVKFHLPDGSETDIVSVPLVVFMVRTPEDFLAFTRARIPDPETGHPDTEKLGAFLGEHPETGIAIQKSMGKLAPTTSFATSDYRAPPRLPPDRRRGRRTLGPLRLGARGGHRVPHRRAARGRIRTTICRRRSASGSGRATPASRWSSHSPTRTTRSTIRPTSGRASARSSSSASSR